MHQLQELVRLHRKGTGAREVARLLQISPNTEREYRTALGLESLLFGPVEDIPDLETLKVAVLKHRPPVATPVQELSSIEMWSQRVEGLMEKGLKPKAIYDRLKLEEGAEFEGSYWAVKRLVRSLRLARGVEAEDIAIPVTTNAGEVAQVDFGYAGKLLDPQSRTLRRAWVFVMTLCYSRHMFAKVVFNQKSETWLQLHVDAFNYFGGVVDTVVPDNLKAAVVRTAFAAGEEREPALNRSYRELARYFNFKVDPTPPRSPEKKGKVESSVKYARRNALAGREGEEIGEVNRCLLRWLEEIAGKRNHGTTGRVPLDVFATEERPVLRSLPEKPFEVVTWKKASVREAHVVFDRRFYSVPWKLSPPKGQKREAWVRATRSSVCIYVDDVRVATHARLSKGTHSTKEEHLPKHRRDLRHRSHGYWQDRAEAIGLETLEYVKEIFTSDDVLSQLRKVQDIVMHLESYPRERAESTARRARFYGTYSYQGVKKILEKGLDLEPLPSVPVQTRNEAPPRFARSIKELLSSVSEVCDEPN